MPPFLSRVVSLALALVGSLVAQGRGPALAAALARGDRAAAEAIAEAEPDPARRALCEAALQPLPQRVGAFLSVAQRFPRHDACGEALLAGCATVLLQQERWPAQLGPLPDLAEALGDAWWWGRRDPRCAERLAVVVPALLHEVRRWEAERPRARELPLLQRLARSCACPVVRSTPLTIASGEEWPLPQPLGEDLLVAVRRLDDDASTPLDLVDALARDSSRRWLVPAREGLAALPSPGDGRWLLEVQSVSQPWRALRVVDVGSLRATVFADPGVVVWVADGDLWSDDGSITWTGRVDADPPIPMPPATGGIGVWRLPPHLGPRGFVQARQGDARARIPVWESDARAAPRELAVAHWQCDRPLHRPGEQVQGRVVVRAVSWQGTGLAAVPTTAAVAASAVPFVCTWPDGTREERRLDLDARGIATFAVQVPAGATPGRACAELGPLPNGASLRCELTEVAAFRRPAVVGELRGPERVALADGNVVLRLQVAWASGGPAAVPVDVAVGRADE
ncbi:MAG: hypothetical protein JNK15_14980, partial [Planctomycetes bacterium]|nr:hypothetical protein [Planctomycetota bacterium]